MRRVLVWLAACALLAPAAAWAHATLKGASPGFEQELSASPKAVKLHFDQFVSFPSVKLYDADGKTYAVKAVVRRAERRRAGPREAAARRLHGALARALGGRARRLGRVDVRRARAGAAADRGVRGGGPDADGAHRAVAVLPLVRGADRVARVPARPRAAVPCRRGSTSGCSRSRSAGVIAVVEIGILAFCLRCEDVLQLPFSEYVYGDLTPIADGTRFGQAFVLMTLGFAFVAAIDLPRVAARPAAAVPAGARAASIGLLSGLSLSGHDAVDAGSSKATELADWVHISAASLWLGGLLALAVAVWPVAPGAPTRGVLPLLPGRGRARRSRARRGHVPLARPRAASERPVDAALRRGAAREDLARRAGGDVGGRPPLRRAATARGRRRRARRRGSGGACSARAWSAWPCCSWRRSWSTRSRRRGRRRRRTVTQAAAAHR